MEENKETVLETTKQTKKKNKLTIAKSICGWVFGIIIAFLVIFQMTSLITAPSNHGVANFFSYSMLNVLTDSMEPTMKVGTGIIIQKVDINVLKASSKKPNTNEFNFDGDVITFYDTSRRAIITHRIVEIDKDASGNITAIYTFGDNPESQTCPSWVSSQVPCTYPANRDTILPENYIGKLVVVSDSLGGFISVVQSSWFFFVAVGVPLGVLFIWSLVDIYKATKYKEEPETCASGSSDPKGNAKKKESSINLNSVFVDEIKKESKEALKEELIKQIKDNYKKKGDIDNVDEAILHASLSKKKEEEVKKNSFHQGMISDAKKDIKLQMKEAIKKKLLEEEKNNSINSKSVNKNNDKDIKNEDDILNSIIEEKTAVNKNGLFKEELEKQSREEMIARIKKEEKDRIKKQLLEEEKKNNK